MKVFYICLIALFVMSCVATTQAFNQRALERKDPTQITVSEYYQLAYSPEILELDGLLALVRQTSFLHGIREGILLFANNKERKCFDEMIATKNIFEQYERGEIDGNEKMGIRTMVELFKCYQPHHRRAMYEWRNK